MYNEKFISRKNYFLIQNGLDFNAKEINTLSPEETLLALWGLDGYAILKYVESIDLKKYDLETFLTQDCISTSDFGQLILSGLKKVFPTVYRMIPEDMSVFAFVALYELLYILNVRKKED